jgi:hypothetical protein
VEWIRVSIFQGPNPDLCWRGRPGFPLQYRAQCLEKSGQEAADAVNQGQGNAPFADR